MIEIINIKYKIPPAVAVKFGHAAVFEITATRYFTAAVLPLQYVDSHKNNARVLFYRHRHPPLQCVGTLKVLRYGLTLSLTIYCLNKSYLFE